MCLCVYVRQHVCERVYQAEEGGGGWRGWGWWCVSLTPFSNPVLISGPLVSSAMATHFSGTRAAAFLMLAMLSA